MKQIRKTISKNAEKFLALPTHVQGILVAILAMVGLSGMGAIFKHLGQDLHPSQIIALRQVMMVVLFIPALVRATPEERKITRFDLFVARAVLMFFSMLASVTAIIHLPLATSTTLSFTRTFFITVFAILILKEVVGPRRLGALLVGFLGVLVVARPIELLTVGTAGFDFNIVLSLVAAACLALNQIIVRIQSRNNRPNGHRCRAGCPRRRCHGAGGLCSLEESDDGTMVPVRSPRCGCEPFPMAHGLVLQVDPGDRSCPV